MLIYIYLRSSRKGESFIKILVCQLLLCAKCRAEEEEKAMSKKKPAKKKKEEEEPEGEDW